MSRANSTREAWHPLTRQDNEMVRAELDAVLVSPHFANSKRYPALLRYVVEKTLAGQADLLKERTLGIEVFDRPASYDTSADTVVRYTAGEVRKRLSLYYHELDHKPPVQISLPAGSYVPEFLPAQDEHETNRHLAGGLPLQASKAEVDAPVFVPQPPNISLIAYESGLNHTDGTRLAPVRRRAGILHWGWLAGALAALALFGTWRWGYHPTQAPLSPLDQFWMPTLHDQHVAYICTGGAVFAQNNYSGVMTAGKDTDYPFISLQAGSAIAQISALAGRNGVSTELLSAPTTPLTQLLGHTVILLGGYNNQWTLRLSQPLRFHFAPEINASLVDSAHPEVHWGRDHSQPYSSADDYALIARFRDPTTDNWIIILAGVGRNGSEAAAQFITSPHYMQLLRDRIGKDISKRNVEAVLKLSVIDGKTGAPSLVAVHDW